MHTVDAIRNAGKPCAAVTVQFAAQLQGGVVHISERHVPSMYVTNGFGLPPEATVTSVFPWHWQWHWHAFSWLLRGVCSQSKDAKTKDGKGGVAIKQPYLRVVGLQEDIEGDSHNSPTFT